jgi:anti-sigma regulatory factor (Ser/Thr protein kinase)
MSTLTASVDLPPVISSIPAARHLVMGALRAWKVPHDVDDAALLVTELVANVIDHAPAETSLTVEATASDGWLRISVADGSSIPPVLRDPRPDQPRGRGLRLVQAIADRWGSEAYRDGKRVWFELSPTDG